MELHFQTITIIAPYVNGTCTVPDGSGWSQGYKTPLTCKESSDSTYGYTFATTEAPIGFVETTTADYESRFTHRCIASISERSAELKPAEGIAARGNLNVTFTDFDGDPIDGLRDTGGSYFSKFKARNILIERDVIIKRYKVSDGITELVSTSYYKVDKLSDMGNGKWSLACKSVIEYTYEDYSKFPIPTGAKLRLDIDDTTTTIPVFGSDYAYSVDDVIRIGKEFMQVTAVNGSGNSMTLTVAGRGIPLFGSVATLTFTEREEHDAGDDIQVCYVADNIDIQTLLYDIFIAAGVDASYINLTEWQSEINDYWSGTKLNTVLGEPVESKKLLNQLCGDFMLDLWFDPNSNQIKLSAVSVWRGTNKTLIEGRGITYDSIKVKELPELRCSRAYVYHDKRYKAENDDIVNFRAFSFFIDLTLEASDFYGREKSRFLGGSEYHTATSGDLRTQREVARFNSVPRRFDWTCEERYLDYSVGDIVEFKTDYVTDASGQPENIRAQVLSVSPKYPQIGRSYSVSAMTYAPAFDSGQQFVFTGEQQNINLWIQVGAPTQVVDIVIIFDNLQASSDSVSVPSVRNGNFAVGSTVKIIFINNSKLNSKGGDGGNGASLIFDDETNSWIPLGAAGRGDDGGTCFSSDGIETEIWLSGSTDGYTANGYIHAAGGGGGGGGYTISGGGGGGGGAGVDVGAGGIGGAGSTSGDSGETSTETQGGAGGSGAGGSGGSGGNLGQNGTAGTGAGAAQGGLAGKGVFKTSGETVTINGGTAARFINGSGN